LKRKTEEVHKVNGQIENVQEKVAKIEQDSKEKEEGYVEKINELTRNIEGIKSASAATERKLKRMLQELRSQLHKNNSDRNRNSAGVLQRQSSSSSAVSSVHEAEPAIVPPPPRKHVPSHSKSTTTSRSAPLASLSSSSSAKASIAKKSGQGLLPSAHQLQLENNHLLHRIGAHQNKRIELEEYVRHLKQNMEELTEDIENKNLIIRKYAIQRMRTSRSFSSSFT